MTTLHTTPAEKQKTERAMSALDTMATTWAMSFNLREGVKAMMALPDGEDRLVAFVKHCYGEGLYEGRTSHDKDVAAQTAKAAPQQGVSVPPGWKLVPIEPTPEMLDVVAFDGVANLSPKNACCQSFVPHDVAGRIYRAMVAAAPQPPASAPPATGNVGADTLDWPLPCDVTVGHGTMRKGVPLRSLVLRMKTLYEMATGNNADEVANRTPVERQALWDKSPMNLMNYEVGGRFKPKLSPEAQALSDQLNLQATAQPEPVMHLRQYGDVTGSQMEEYIQTGRISEAGGDAAAQVALPPGRGMVPMTESWKCARCGARSVQACNEIGCFAGENSEPPGDWQPIETVPQTEERFLVISRSGRITIDTGHFMHNMMHAAKVDGDECFYTNWARLPKAPPAAATALGDGEGYKP